MIEWVLIVAARLAPLGVPAEPPPPRPARTSPAPKTPERPSPAKVAPSARSAKTPTGRRAPKRPPTAEELLMLRNAEFLRMLDLLIDLPLLAEDEELEISEKGEKK